MYRLFSLRLNRPNDKINVIILITVTVPLIQILVLLHSLFNLLLFYPIKLFSNADSFNFKMYSLFLNGWFAILVYQVTTNIRRLF